MKCINCGADYDTIAEKCPYCGSENQSVIKEELKELKLLRKEKARGLKASQQTYGEELKDEEEDDNLFDPRIKTVFMLVLSIFVIIIYVVVNLAKMDISIIPNISESKLEKMYNEGQYDEMVEYIKDKKLTAESTDYYGVVRYYDNYICLKEKNELNSALDEFRSQNSNYSYNLINKKTSDARVYYTDKSYEYFYVQFGLSKTDVCKKIQEIEQKELEQNSWWIFQMKNRNQ